MVLRAARACRPMGPVRDHRQRLTPNAVLVGAAVHGAGAERG